MGWLERIVIQPWGVRAKAKLDSGAKTSSLNAKNIKRFEQDGEEWVRFTLAIQDADTREQKELEIERPLARNVRIKRHEFHPQRRSAVMMQFCLNGRSYETEFTLADRAEFKYPVLLGRSFLADTALIDPRAKWLGLPECELVDGQGDTGQLDATESDAKTNGPNSARDHNLGNLS